MKWMYSKGELSRCCCDAEDVFAVYSRVELNEALDKVHANQNRIVRDKTRNYDFMRRTWPIYAGKTNGDIDTGELERALEEVKSGLTETADILTRTEEMAKRLVHLLEATS